MCCHRDHCCSERAYHLWPSSLPLFCSLAPSHLLPSLNLSFYSLPLPQTGAAADSTSTAEAMERFAQAADALHEDSLRISMQNPLSPSLLDLSTKTAAAGLLEGFMKGSSSSSGGDYGGIGGSDGSAKSAVDSKATSESRAGRLWLAHSAAAQVCAYGWWKRREAQIGVHSSIYFFRALFTVHSALCITDVAV